MVRNKGPGDLDSYVMAVAASRALIQASLLFDWRRTVQRRPIRR
jgi:hypothetical protein